MEQQINSAARGHLLYLATTTIWGWDFYGNAGNSKYNPNLIRKENDPGVTIVEFVCIPSLEWPDLHVQVRLGAEIQKKGCKLGRCLQQWR